MENENPRRWPRPKPPPSPLSQILLIWNFNKSSSVVEKSRTELALDSLEDMLTHFGSCLVQQLREEQFLPRSMFRMNDIIEVGGAELRLNNGRRFSPNTQIRFLGSFYPAIIKIVRASRYDKIMEETRQAIACMHGRLRIAIIIKIDDTAISVNEQPSMQINHGLDDTTVSGKEIYGRITVTLFQLIVMDGNNAVQVLHISRETEVFPRPTNASFNFNWQNISPDPWNFTVPMPQATLYFSPLSELVQRYVESNAATTIRHRTLNHVDFSRMPYLECDQAREPPAGPSQ